MKKAEKLKEILALLDKDTVTAKEFADQIKTIITHIKNLEANIAETFRNIDGNLSSKSERLKGDHADSVAKLKAEYDGQIRELKKKLDDGLDTISKRLATIKDGKDADENTIVDKVLSKIEIPEIEEIEQSLPRLGGEIRNALELLQGDDRLDVKYIRGIKTLIMRLVKKNKESQPMMGGGLRPATIGIETPAGNLDNNNTAFFVQWKPMYITLNGQAIYEGSGYSLSSSNGSLSINLDNAPSASDILRSHYSTN